MSLQCHAIELSDSDLAFLDFQQHLRAEICTAFAIPCDSLFPLEQSMNTQATHEALNIFHETVESPQILDIKPTIFDKPLGLPSPNRRYRRALAAYIAHTPEAKSQQRYQRAQIAAQPCQRCQRFAMVPQDWPPTLRAIMRCQCQAQQLHRCAIASCGNTFMTTQREFTTITNVCASCAEQIQAQRDSEAMR